MHLSPSERDDADPALGTSIQNLNDSSLRLLRYGYWSEEQDE